MDSKESAAIDLHKPSTDALEDVPLEEEESYDRLDLKGNKDCQKMLESQTSLNETVVYSNHLKKINKRGIEQERILLITDRAVYNLMPKNPGKCKRRIPIEDIGALSLATLSNEFVLHVPNEYDYRFKSLEKDTIAKVLKQTYEARAELERQVYDAVRVFPVQRIAERSLKHVTHNKGTSQKLHVSIFDTAGDEEKKEREKEENFTKPLMIVSDSESFAVERNTTDLSAMGPFPEKLSLSFNI